MYGNVIIFEVSKVESLIIILFYLFKYNNEIKVIFFIFLNFFCIFIEKEVFILIESLFIFLLLFILCGVCNVVLVSEVLFYFL